MADTCGKCSKKVYKTEEMKGGGKVYHKACFKCMADGCGITLTTSSFMAAEAKIWCKKHVPKPKATSTSQDMHLKHAVNVPKKESESVGNVQKGGVKSFVDKSKIKSPDAKSSESKGVAAPKRCDPEPTPAPEPAPEPVPEPQPVPEEPQPEPVPEPQPVPEEPQPEPVPEPAPEEPQPEPVPEPAPVSEEPQPEVPPEEPAPEVPAE